MTGTTQDDGDAGGSKLLAPVSGLLAIVFAVMAGASLSYALGQSTAALSVPAVLAAASVGCMYLKRRFEAEAPDE